MPPLSVLKRSQEHRQIGIEAALHNIRLRQHIQHRHALPFQKRTQIEIHQSFAVKLVEPFQVVVRNGCGSGLAGLEGDC
jgi:hypothetical protein